MDVLEKVIDEFVTKDSSNNDAHQTTLKAMEKKNANEHEHFYEETDSDSEEEQMQMNVNVVMKRLIPTQRKNEM